jgi:hypothetical protein
MTFIRLYSYYRASGMTFRNAVKQAYRNVTRSI